MTVFLPVDFGAYTASGVSRVTIRVAIKCKFSIDNIVHCFSSHSPPPPASGRLPAAAVLLVQLCLSLMHSPRSFCHQRRPDRRGMSHLRRTRISHAARRFPALRQLLPA